MKRSIQRRTGLKLWTPEQQHNDDRSNEAVAQTEHPDCDDLDALMDMYTRQAAAETSTIEEQLKQQQRPKGKQGRELKQVEALATPLTQQNKGFQLLSKMGYKAGQGLGKSEQGMVQPIPVQVRTARAGLGVDEQKRERQQQQAELELQRAIKRARQLEQQHEEYRDVVKASFRLKSLQKQLHKAVRATEDLDQQAAVGSNPMLEHICKCLEAADKAGEGEGEEEDVPQEDDGEELDVEGALESLLQYLRTEYYYCLYCGCKYDGADDLMENCPGVHEDDH